MNKRLAALLAGGLIAGGGAVLLWREPPTVVSRAGQPQPDAAPERAASTTPSAADCADPAGTAGPTLQLSIDCEGLRCRFDASGSTGVSAYRWKFSPTDIATEAVVTREFPADGRYPVVASAANACGLADYRTVTLQLAAGEPYSCAGCVGVEAPGRLRPPDSPRTTGQRRMDPRPFSGGTAVPSPDAEDGVPDPVRGMK